METIDKLLDEGYKLWVSANFGKAIAQFERAAAECIEREQYLKAVAILKDICKRDLLHQTAIKQLSTLYGQLGFEGEQRELNDRAADTARAAACWPEKHAYPALAQIISSGTDNYLIYQKPEYRIAQVQRRSPSAIDTSRLEPFSDVSDFILMEMLAAVLTRRLVDVLLTDTDTHYQCDGEKWWRAPEHDPNAQASESHDIVAGLLAEARTFETYGLADKAREAYQRVIALDPTNEKAKKALSD